MSQQKNYSPMVGNIAMQFITDDHPPVKRRIVTAANKLGDTGVLLVGARHWDRVMDAQMNAMAMDKLPPAEVKQGFIDQYGQFLTRVEAKQIALANGQPLIGKDWGKELFSENLH